MKIEPSAWCDRIADLDRTLQILPVRHREREKFREMRECYKRLLRLADAKGHPIPPMAYRYLKLERRPRRSVWIDLLIGAALISLALAVAVALESTIITQPLFIDGHWLQ